VTSTRYPFKVWGGAVGAAGTFTMTGAAEVARFTWSVDSGPSTTVPATGTTSKTATVSYTPATDMVHTLRVTARDAAGNASGVYNYEFWVSPVANRYSYWKFDESSGTNAADSGAGGSAMSPGTLSGTVAFGPGYPIPGGTGRGASYSGGSGQIVASDPVLDTTKSFTVMAWVRPTTLTGGQTVLSQDGVNVSRFLLRYDNTVNGGAGGWCFGMRPGDANASNVIQACATGTVGSSTRPVVGQWVHVAGVYDPTTNTIQVHVMGNQDSCDGEMAQTSFTGAWSATGRFAIGRAKAAGVNANHWRGDIDDVYAFQRKLGSVEICQRANP
jgi:hypothetical protein